LIKINKKILIIADLHISDDENLFENFINNHAKNSDELYILGDLFNLYLGDDLIHSHYQKTIDLLHNASKNTKIFIMAGNKDFLFGSEFAKKSGAKIIKEPYILQNNQQKFVLIHGDSLVTDDTKYQWFKKIIQSNFIKFTLLSLPIKFRIKIANKVQNISNNSKHTKPMAIMDVNEKSVIDFMQKYKNSDLIHGHTHKKNIHKYTGFKRYVLGAWSKTNGNFLQIQDGGIYFVNF